MLRNKDWRYKTWELSRKKYFSSSYREALIETDKEACFAKTAIPF